MANLLSQNPGFLQQLVDAGGGAMESVMPAREKISPHHFLLAGMSTIARAYSPVWAL